MAVLRWTGKLLSADDLRRHWTGQRELIVLGQAIVTPLAVDELKKHGVRAGARDRRPGDFKRQAASGEEDRLRPGKTEPAGKFRRSIPGARRRDPGFFAKMRGIDLRIGPGNWPSTLPVAIAGVAWFFVPILAWSVAWPTRWRRAGRVCLVGDPGGSRPDEPWGQRAGRGDAGPNLLRGSPYHAEPVPHRDRMSGRRRRNLTGA